MIEKKGIKKYKSIVYGKLLIGILLASTLIIWAVVAGIKRNNLLGAASLGIIALTIGIFFIVYAKRELTSIKKGLPVEDERSKKVMNAALAKAYLISIYFILFLSWASDELIQFRDVSQGLNISILGMAIIFGLCWVYYNRKPDL